MQRVPLLKSIISELREYSKIRKLTFIEWAEFGYDEIPDNALNINVEYDENDIDIRYFNFKSKNSNNDEFLNNLKIKVNQWIY